MDAVVSENNPFECKGPTNIVNGQTNGRQKPGATKTIYITSHRMIHFSSLHILTNQGPVVQSIVSITSSLRGQLVTCFMIL